MQSGSVWLPEHRTLLHFSGSLSLSFTMSRFLNLADTRVAQVPADHPQGRGNLNGPPSVTISDQADRRAAIL